jgi:hypothetical protein
MASLADFPSRTHRESNATNRRFGKTANSTVLEKRPTGMADVIRSVYDSQLNARDAWYVFGDLHRFPRAKTPTTSVHLVERQSISKTVWQARVAKV